MVGGRPLSLRDRVSLAGLGVLAAWVVLLIAGVNGFVSAELRRQADDILTTRAQAAATTVEVDPLGNVTVRDTLEDSAIDVGTWIFAGADVVERPVRGSGLNSEAAQLAETGPKFREANGIRWYAEPVISNGEQRATVVTSVSLASYKSAQRTLLLSTAALGLLLLLAVWLTLRAGVGRALKPVAEMTHQSARWSADDVDRRFGPGPRPEELEDLAATLDGLLDRLSGVLRHEKLLSAEISHELRTPVTRILAEVELLRRHDDSPEAASSALNSIESSAQEMQQVLEVLMTAARSASSTIPGRCEVIGILRRVGQTHQRQGIDLRVDPAGPIFASVDAALLERAMNPILDNAVRFAAHRIEIDVKVGSKVVISVRDDGAGIADADLDSVFQPGWTRSAGASGVESGAGLGLALARRLLTSGGGSIEAVRCSSGALLVIELPVG